MFSKTVLDNGVRILSEEIPHTRSVSLGVWVENGSRHELRHQGGLSHFIEHLLFKGTRRRGPAEIAQEMDSVGGMMNAFTGKEQTCYYAKVLDENLSLAADLLTDIFLHSVFDGEEIERERSVVLQEIAQAEDTPEDFVFDLFSLDFFGNHPLGRPICGDVDTVSGFQRDDIVRFVQDRYLPGRVILAAAGHVRHEELVEALRGEFATLEPAPITNPAATAEFCSGVFLHEKQLEQVHLCLGMSGIHQTHKDRYTAHVLNTLLGGGMSSRLFQEVRERRGKAYSVYSFLSSYSDVGYMGIYAGTKAAWAREVVEVVIHELLGLADGKLSDEEFTRAQNQVIGNTLLGLETTDSWMSHMTRSEIYFGREVSVGEISEGVRAVTRGEVVAMARSLFRPETMTLTLLGDLQGHGLADLRLSS